MSIHSAKMILGAIKTMVLSTFLKSGMVKLYKILRTILDTCQRFGTSDKHISVNQHASNFNLHLYQNLSVILPPYKNAWYLHCITLTVLKFVTK